MKIGTGRFVRLVFFVSVRLCNKRRAFYAKGIFVRLFMQNAALYAACNKKIAARNFSLQAACLYTNTNMCLKIDYVI